MGSEWTEYLDLRNKNGGVELYPLQFAYRNRITENDVVYMFDEVGSGKTISTGIMLLEWLNNEECKTKKALIITTPSQARGLFRADLEDKFATPLRRLAEETNTNPVYTIINNHYSNIAKVKNEKEKYGIVIIDEAQDFLISPDSDTDKKRVAEVMQVRAEKVVFASATPIKYGRGDIKDYVRIAQCILGKITNTEQLSAEEERDIADKSEEILNILSNKGRSDSELISSTFDAKCPVTRYFKDTIKSLQYKKNRKKKGKRTIEIWKKGTEDAIDDLVSRLAEVTNNIANEKPSRCVVFVHRIKDAKTIYEKCKAKGITAVAITGDDDGRAELKKVSGQYSESEGNYKDEELPQVIAVTYRMAYAGVNLPRYNYVVNYYVPQFTSDLEQLFGRVDRLNTEYDEIHMCYYLGGTSTSYKNFSLAFIQYIYNMISAMPVRNILLDDKILEEVFKSRDKCIEWANEDIKYYEQLLTDVKGNVSKCIGCSDELDERLQDLAEDFREAVKEECGYMLDETAYAESDTMDKRKVDELFSELVDDCINQCEKRRKLLESKKLSDDDKEYFRELVRRVGDNIFYFPDDVNWNEKSIEVLSKLKVVDAVACADSIESSDAYKAYEESFEKDVKLAVIVKELHERFDDVISQFLLGLYQKNQLSMHYQILSKKKTDFWSQENWQRMPEAFMEFLQSDSIEGGTQVITEEDRELWQSIYKYNENYDAREFFLNVGPFKVMMEKVKSRFVKNISDRKGELLIRFDTNPFINTYKEAPAELHNEIETFKRKRKDGTEEVVYRTGFITDEYSLIKATPFYKLIYCLLGDIYRDRIYTHIIYTNGSWGSYRAREYMEAAAFDKNWLSREKTFVTDDNITKEMIDTVAIGERRQKASERIKVKREIL